MVQNSGPKLLSAKVVHIKNNIIYLTSGSIHIKNSGSKLESKSLILFMNRQREINSEFTYPNLPAVLPENILLLERLVLKL